MAPDDLTIEKSLELLEQGTQIEQPLGFCPETHKPVYVKVGRFGPYVQLGDSEDEEKPKNASLLKGMEPTHLTLDDALRLLALPREVGRHPESHEPIVASNGRFGPYIKCGAETRSLPAAMSPLDVTLEQSLTLLETPTTRGNSRGAPEALRTFESSPVTGQPVKLLNGRYGLYVTDGVTNASLPKGATAEDFTLPVALQLLAERAAAGGGTKKKAARKTPSAKKSTKTTTKKSTSTKKSRP